MTEKSMESYGEEEEEGRHLHLHKHREIRDSEEEMAFRVKIQRTGISMTKKSIEKTSEEEEGSKSKSLYICSFERNQSIDKSKNWGAYAVRAADLTHLYDSNSKLELRQVGYRAGEDLPAAGGCGVLGSRIVFASGLKHSFGPRGPPYGPEASTRAYAFDTSNDTHDIVDMDESLHEGKHVPLTLEVAGKLYVLSAKWFGLSLNSFEVFDPVHRNWSLLPQFPDCGQSFSCAIAGTRLFASNENTPVCCLDLANPTQWTPVPTMCRGGPFPFLGKALVLDTKHRNKKIVFTAENYDDNGCRSRVLVYLLSLNESQETITPIHELKLPYQELPPGKPSQYHFLHLGDHNVCLVIPKFNLPYEDLPEDHYVTLGTHLLQAALIPFQFEFDISKGITNCFTVQFQTHHILEYRTNPSTLPFTRTLGCFVL
ncbi:hypothetical protein ABKV19_026198 [Rosa sericea]